jgi:hypothetical protein
MHAWRRLVHVCIRRKARICKLLLDYIINGLLFINYYLSRQAQLICANSIISLGRIGIALSTVSKKVADDVLQIYQQRFCSPPSQLDTLIIAQLADMLIAGCVSYRGWGECNVCVYYL